MVIVKPVNVAPPGITGGQRRPLLLGIVGDSGSGKSTLMRGLVALFGEENITEICLDDYHLYDRVGRARLGLTALNPAANNLRLMQEQLQALRDCQPIFKPVYDHTTGTFAPAEWVVPREIVIVHGLFTLFTPELAALFDLSIYLQPEEELRLTWKVERDIHKRGYSLEEVLRQIEERRPDAVRFIEPQKSQADLIVSFHRPYSGAPNNPLAVRLFRRNEARCPELSQWVLPSLAYSAKPNGELLKIPAALDPLRARNLESRWQMLAGLPGSEEPSLGMYQSLNGVWRQSLSLSLTQLLIAGSLLCERNPARLVA